MIETGPGTGLTQKLTAEEGGYFVTEVRGAGAATRYRFRLGGDEPLYPDPASRYQPEGPHGPSEVVDPGHFAWTDDGWPGVSIERMASAWA